MPRTRSRPENIEFPAYSGRVMVDSYRGRLRVRAWPKKRGAPKSTLVQAQNEWFAAVNQLVKFAPAEQQIAAIDATMGTGVYPRDLLMHTISEGIMDISELNGVFRTYRRPRIDGVDFQGFRLERTSGQGLPAFVNTTIIWQDPRLDSAAFWDAGSPTVITIPAGVTVMFFNFQWLTDNEAFKYTDISILGSSRGTVARDKRTTDFRFAGSLPAGPIDVVAGETYHVTVNPTQATNLLTGAMVAFTGIILGTT